VESFGINGSISFDGITTQKGFVEADTSALHQLCWAGIGQHTDLINPCQFMTFMGAVANGGVAVNPYVTEQVSVGGSVTYEAGVTSMDRIMSRSTAEVLQKMMRRNVEQKYGSDHFPGLTVCAKSGTAEKDGDLEANALFAGFVSDEAYPLAFVVIVEDGGYGASTCVPMISLVLSACKEVMDAR
jgi:peptidoglycan glycosyltransferase